MDLCQASRFWEGQVGSVPCSELNASWQRLPAGLPIRFKHPIVAFTSAKIHFHKPGQFATRPRSHTDEEFEFVSDVATHSVVFLHLQFWEGLARAASWPRSRPGGRASLRKFESEPGF